MGRDLKICQRGCQDLKLREADECFSPNRVANSTTPKETEIFHVFKF